MAKYENRRLTHCLDRLITSKDHASIQISIVDVDSEGKALSTVTTFALCGQVRADGEADDSLNRLATKSGSMFKNRKHSDSTAAQKPYRPSFWRTEPTVPQVSEAETVKNVKSSVKAPPTAVGSGAGRVGNRTQPIPVPAPATTTNALFQRQNQSSGSFNVVRSGSGIPNSQDSRNAVSTTGHANSTSTQSAQTPTQLHSNSQSKSISMPVAPVSHYHRASVNSLNSVDTASTSHSSFERISADNLQHSWGSATLSTAPSSTVPKSTESLVRIPAAASITESKGREAVSTSDKNLITSGRFPLVESDSQKNSAAIATSHTHTQGDQASNALPLPNSEYEAPARVRSLRRSKGNIVDTTNPISSIRIATSKSGRESPAPTSSAHNPPTPPKSQEHHRSKSDMPSTQEIAYVQSSHRQDQGEHHPKSKLLARVMSTSSTTKQSSNSSSTPSTRPMSTITTPAPRAHSKTQSANPDLQRLLQTTISHNSSNGSLSASPAVDQSRLFASIQSPRQPANEGPATSWTSAKSPTMTSAPTYSSLTSTMMSPHLSAVASPRTLVSSSQHPSDPAPITPSQHRHNFSTPSTSSVVGRGVYVEEDYESSLGTSTATPNSPASKTVLALFSSLTSRHHHSSKSHPARSSSLSNPPITATEVTSPRLAAAAAGILSPPPLPPQSTRPDLPPSVLGQGQIQGQQSMHFNPTSPRHNSTEFTKTGVSRTAVESRRDPVSEMKSPIRSQPSTLQSYGLESSTATPASPANLAQRALMNAALDSPRTLMSDSEYTTVTTVSVTRSTYVSGHQVPAVSSPAPLERRSSSSYRRDGASSTPPHSVSNPPMLQNQPTGGSSWLPGMFRSRSPRPFPAMERSSSPRPPTPSKTPPPRAATSSPRRFNFSFPINLRHKGKDSMSKVSVEAVIDGSRSGFGREFAMSSQGSLLPSRTPDPQSEYSSGNGRNGNNKKARLAMIASRRRQRNEDETETDGENDVEHSDEPPLEARMHAVHQWSLVTEQSHKSSGKSRRFRPGVAFDLPLSDSDRDDTGMTAVSVAPGGGRPLRHDRSYQQFSDAEAFVY
ncbi:hypothetical protein CPB86DRAFT_850397 [Serendipita vermifera]|nr:hypothetical protein CPB86DRAFT_850397 [Serendipita vermifera]